MGRKPKKGFVWFQKMLGKGKKNAMKIHFPKFGSHVKYKGKKI